MEGTGTELCPRTLVREAVLSPLTVSQKACSILWWGYRWLRAEGKEGGGGVWS